MTTVSRIARAQALRAAVNEAVKDGPLRLFAAELKALAELEVRVAKGGLPPPAPAPTAISEQRRGNVFVDFFGDAAGALAEDLRDSMPGSPRPHALVDFFGETDARAIAEDLAGTRR